MSRHNGKDSAQLGGGGTSHVRGGAPVRYIAFMPKPLRVRERRIESFDGTDLAYHVVGEGLPVLLCNGLGGSWKAWRYQIGHLSDRYRFVSWDYRGLFRSGPPPDRHAIRVEHNALDALRIMDAEGIERAALFGWSMGVQVALEVFRNAPDRVACLMLMAGAAGRPWSTVLNLRVMAHVLPPLIRTVRGMPRLTTSITQRLVRSPETLIWAKRLGLTAASLDEQVFQELADTFVDLDLDLYLHMLELLGEHDATDVLPEVDVPTLVVVGDRDFFTPRQVAESMVRQVRGAEMMIIPGGTHYVAVEHPEVLNLRIEKFMRERGYASPVAP
jgi:pimeloyl-ACP methyl ester carboxylesterase